MVAAVLVGIGATLWYWPQQDVAVQVGPRLPVLSASPAAPGSRELSRTSITAPAHRSAAAVSGTAASRAAGALVPRAGVQTVSSTGPSNDIGPSGDTARSSAAGTSPSVERVAAAPIRSATAPVRTSKTAAAAAPAIPRFITVPFASESHPDGVRMTVIPHGPTAGGEMWIPGPEEGIDQWANAVSWLNSPGFAGPYSTHGAVIIAGHINWKGTAGALSDLAEYGEDDVGKTLAVTMTDGRVRIYRITRGLSIDKAALSAESNQGPLHTAMFGQLGSYGTASQPTEELRLISCGGEYDPAARSYESNILVIARPVT